MSEVALHIDQLKKTYKNKFSALKGVSFDIEAGDFFCLLGPNGAGKTTLIGIVTSLVNKTAGRVKVFGHDIDTDLTKAKMSMSVVPQELNLPFFETAWQILLRQAGFYGFPKSVAKARAEKYLKALHLWEKRHSRVYSLSGGMKRRLMIARALMCEPRLLILDEPTAGVDIEIRRNIWSFLQELNRSGTTILLTTHYLEEAENLCNRIALIDHGEVKYQGSLHQFINQLDIETIILTLERAVETLPVLEGLVYRQIERDILEVDLTQDMTVSSLINLLAAHDIAVSRMRNKVNRLEELFVRLTSGLST